MGANSRGDVRKLIVWSNFPKKLHEHERNLTEKGGGAPLAFFNEFIRSIYKFNKKRDMQ